MKNSKLEEMEDAKGGGFKKISNLLHDEDSYMMRMKIPSCHDEMEMKMVLLPLWYLIKFVLSDVNYGFDLNICVVIGLCYTKRNGLNLCYLNILLEMMKERCSVDLWCIH